MHFYRGSGAGAARYFNEGHRGAEGYYRGRDRVAVEIDTWAGGERSEATVFAGPGEFVGWVEGLDLASGLPKGRIRSGGKDRRPLRFVETVVNNPKSLSIVASQNPVVAAALDRTLGRQADEIARYLSVVAVSRIGARGAQREVGGLSVETARVRHLTSREGDPHRHVHLLLNTRVRTRDGAWHGLHSVAIRQHIGAVHARGMRVLVTDRELRDALAGEGYTLGADGEIDQARGAVELLSKRAAQTAQRRAGIEAEWRAAHPGREPSQRVRNGWDQQAWADGRRAKPGEGESPEEVAARVRIELAAAGFDFTLGAQRERGAAVPAPGVGQVDRDGLAEEVVAVLSAHKSAWSAADVAEQVDTAVARSGVLGAPQAVAELAEDVGARALGRCQSVLDPGRHTPTSMSRHLTSAAVLEADLRLNVGLAGLAGGPAGRDELGGELAAGQGLGAGQVEAVAVVCGWRRLEVVIGPAGAGKTRMLGVAQQRLEAQGRSMVVVAPTRKGAQVAGAELGVAGASLSKLLHEHGFRWDPLGRWSRLAVGQDDPATGRPYQGPSGGSMLSARSVIVVDEAGLMTVDQANALVDLAAETGAAVRLVGDPRQLGAVGRGGVMETAARWAEGAVTLDEVHRFLTVGVGADGLPVTENDVGYADLSLRLRDGGDPGGVADELVERGAVVVHGRAADAVAAIAEEAAARGGGGGSLVVTVATNADAWAVNEAVRSRRVAAGEVDDARVAFGMDGERIGAGDRIVTRRNDTARDVANREMWTVDAVVADGTVLAHRGERRVRLDTSYLAGAVQLGYATTDYGNQGVTADRSVTWVTGATTAGGLYVGATRGRYGNTLHVVAGDGDDARRQLATAAVRDRADRGLDAARDHAQSDALAVVSAPGAGGQPPAAGHQIDPEQWRTEAELDAEAAAVEERYERRMWALQDTPVLSERELEQRSIADGQEAAEARERLAAYRAEAARVAAGRDEMVAAAAADYFAARDDARVIAAGPGRFGRRAEEVHAALARREEVSDRWDDPQPPGVGWSDDEVRGAASAAVDRIVDDRLLRLETLIDQEEGRVDLIGRRFAERLGEQAALQDLNRRWAEQRQELDAAREQARADIARARAVRAERTETMTPDEVAAADAARDALRRTLEVGRERDDSGFGFGF